jgi:hypothetical protein
MDEANVFLIFPVKGSEKNPARQRPDMLKLMQ